MDGNSLAPQSIEAEEAVLGSILIDPGVLLDMPFLTREMFFIVRYGWIFEAMRSLLDRGEPVDYLTVVTELEEKGKLTEIGGAAVIVKLINATPSSLNADAYARIVERMYIRRRFIEAAEAVAKVAHSDETDIGEVVRIATGAVDDVAIEFSRGQGVAVSIKETATDLWENATVWHGDPGAVWGIKTNLHTINRLTWGFHRGKLYYFTARPGHGKSAIFARICRGMAQEGRQCLFYALEMSGFDMTARMACQISNIPWDDVAKGKLSDQDLKRFQDACIEISHLPIAFDDAAGATVRDLRDKTEAYERLHGPVDAVFIDTATLVQGIGKSDLERTTQVSRALKDWAHAVDYPIIAAVQMNREVEGLSDKRPHLSNMRGTGAWEEDADNAYGIHRPGLIDPDEEDNLIVVTVLKVRQYGAPVGTIGMLAWNGSCFGIEERQHDNSMKGPTKQLSFTNTLPVKDGGGPVS